MGRNLHPYRTKHVADFSAYDDFQIFVNYAHNCEVCLFCCVAAIGGATGKLLQRNTEVLNQISTNIKTMQVGFYLHYQLIVAKFIAIN